MTIREISAKYELSPSTVYRNIKSGRLPAVKLGEGQYKLPPNEVFYNWLANRFRKWFRCPTCSGYHQGLCDKNGGAS
jgi:excisionase family DNA binding protein